MKTILNNIMAAAIICCIFLFTGCPNSAIPKTDITSKTSVKPQIQPREVSAPDTADISEQELLKLFDLTETKIPASGAAIQDIVDRYKKAGGHFKMDIGASVYKPRLGGIKADDYTGSLEIEYCIAEEDQIEAMLDGDLMPPPIVAIKKAKRTGFRKATKENAETLFNFQIKLTADEQAGNKWEQRELRNHSLLRSEYDYNLKKGIYKVNDPFKKAAYYTVIVNGKEAEDVFALDNPKFFSKCADGADIFIEQISLNKESGSDKLKIHIKFTGEGEGISIEKRPE